MSIVRRSAADALCQGASILVSMAAGIAISRVLGADGRGVYVLATSVASSLLLSLSSFGVPLACRVAVAARPGLLPRVHTFAVLAALLVGGTAGLLLLLLQNQIRSGLLEGLDLTTLVVLAAFLPVLLYQMIWRSLMIGLGRVVLRAVTDLVITVLNALAIFVLLLGYADAATPLLILAWYAMNLAALLMMLAAVRRAGARWRLPGRHLSRRLLGYGRWVYAGDLGSRLRTLLDQLFINAAGGEALLGIYNQASSLASRSGFFSNSLEASIYQQVVAAPSRQSGLLVAAAFRQMLLIGAVLTAAAWLAAPLIPLIYGADFAGSVTPFRVLVPAFCLVAAARMIPAYFSGHLRRPRIVMAMNWLSVAVQVLLTLLLIRVLGALQGVVWATALTFLFISAGFIALFAARPETPPARELIAFRHADFARWARLLRRQV